MLMVREGDQNISLTNVLIHPTHIEVYKCKTLTLLSPSLCDKVCVCMSTLYSFLVVVL